jgi:hypothetical protein
MQRRGNSLISRKRNVRNGIVFFRQEFKRFFKGFIFLREFKRLFFKLARQEFL